MNPNYVDVTQKTGYLIKGSLTSWQTKNGPYNVEHLAGITPYNEVIVFWWSPKHDWQAVNVSQKTDRKIITALTSWQTMNGQYNVEHLAGVDTQGDVIVFWWSPQHDWRSVNVSNIAGHKISSALTSWQTKNGPYNVEHLAGTNSAGEVFVFWWSPQHDWQAVNVTSITGQDIKSQLTSWQTKNGQYNVEHLAGISPNDDLISFWWSPQHDWKSINVSNITGKKLSSAVTSWQTSSGQYNVEHLAGTDQQGNLIVSWWSPRHDWQAIIATDSKCRQSALYPSSYQININNENSEILNVKGIANELLHFWWKPSTDWQVIDITIIVKKEIYSAPESWLTPNGNTIVEHVAAEGEKNHLLVFWYSHTLRDVYEKEGQFTPCWKNIGPKNFTCVVLSLCVDPNNESIVYACTQYGGVWRTTNGGRNWIPTMDNLKNMNTGAIDLCRSSPNVLYASMSGSTLNMCRSDNYGSSWYNLADNRGTESRSIAGHVSNPDICYVGSDKSLHKTTNGGASWQISNVVVDGVFKINYNGIFDGNIDDVKMDASNPDTIYIAVRNRGFFKSTDGGSTWFQKGVNVSFQIKDDNTGNQHTVFLNGSARTLISIGEDTRPGKHGTLFIVLKVQGTILVSKNGGDNWTVLPGDNNGYDGQNYWDSCLAVCPGDEDFIAAGGDHIDYTTDANAANPTWNALNSLHEDQQSIAFCHSNPDSFYFSNDGFIGKSINRCSSVNRVSDGLVASQSFNVAVSQTSVLVVGGATYHTGILRTGKNIFSEWEYMAGNEGGLFEIDPTNEDVMFCNPWGGGDLRKSTDGGSNWDSKKLKAIDNNGNLVDTFIDILSIRPDDIKKIYAGGFFGHIHYSIDGGANWDYVKLSNGMPLLPDGANGRNNRIKAFGYCKSNGNNLYLSTGSGNLWHTANGATSASGWQQINTPAAGTITAIAVNNSNPNLVFIAYNSNNSDNLWYGIRLVNGVYSWINISASGTLYSLPPSPIYSIVLDPNHANRIFISTEIGVYYTEDAGIRWYPYNQGMPSFIRVFELVLRESTRVIYATAYGRGIYRRWIGN